MIMKLNTANTDIRTQRPVKRDGSKYISTPDYTRHEYHEDKLAMLVCQIKIWRAKENKWFDIPSAENCLTIRECESIEVTDSTKDLVNKAVVKFPRGTVVDLSGLKNEKVETGTDTDTPYSSTIDKTTRGGDVLVPGSHKYRFGKYSFLSTTPMATNYSDKGVIDFNRTEEASSLLSPNNIATGNRIEIRVGYAYSETEFYEMNTADSDPRLDIIFTGFITSISASTPLELECTNMAHVFRCVNAPNVPAANSYRVKDFLDNGGMFDMLKDTGIELSDYSKGCDITLFGGSISNNLTVADVLQAWNKSGVRCMMRILPDNSGKVELKVGLIYFSGLKGGNLPNSNSKYITYNGDEQKVKIIQFDWDVAEDHLSLKGVDKAYIAVEAHGRVEDKFIKLTVRKNPNSDEDGWLADNGEQFQVVNQRSVTPRKKPKQINGTWSTKRLNGHLTNKVDLNKYTVVPYISTKTNITENELIEEAKRYWENYNTTGISGSIKIFGDLMIRPSDIVGLIDPRNPEKDGYYFVESVSTSFGVNGYRRELKLPYKMANYGKPVKII